MPQNDPFASLPVTKKRKKPGIFDDVTGGASFASAAEDDPFAKLPVQPKSSAARGAASAAIQGAAFGFGDEIGGGLNAVFGKGGNMGERYRQGRDTVRDVDRRFSTEHPMASVGLNIAGAVVPAVATGGATIAGRGLGTAAKIGAGALEGAGFGGLAGAGNAEGGLQGRLSGAAVGGAVGALAGATLVGAGRLGGGVLNQLGIRTEKGIQAQAIAKLRQAALRDQITPQELRVSGREWSLSGKPAVVADLGGENVLGLTRAVANVPGKGKQSFADLLHGRQEGQLERVFGDVENRMGMKGRDMHDVAEELIATRKANAQPLYEAAYAKGRVDDPEIAKTLELPAFKAALKRGMRIAKAEGVDLFPATGPEWGETVQMLDYTKRGMDDLIESRMRGGSMGRTEARALRNRLNDMLERVDAAVPEYAEARSQFAGDSRMMSALEDGQNFLNEDHQITTKQLARLSPGEQEMYRIGALGALRRVMDRTPENMDKLRRVFATPEAKNRLQALLGNPEKFAGLSGDMEKEAQLVHTKNGALVGSRTAPLASEMGDLMQTAVNFGTGNVGGLAKQGLKALVSNRAKIGSDKIADAIGQKLQIRPGTLEFDQLIQEMEASHAAIGHRTVRGRVARRALASGIGGQVSR